MDDSIVVLPHTTEGVAAILKYCHTERIGVIPVSGNTGLVGGTMPIQKESSAAPSQQPSGATTAATTGTTSMVFLCLTKLNEIYSLQPFSGILHCQAGVVLEHLQNYAQERKYRLPLDLGAKGTCCIGGNIATNAGGSYYYKYGNLAANVLGLQVVTATGDILNLGHQQVLKDNTGYKLHQLMIGSEGTLGVITQVKMLCRPLVPDVQTALVALDSYDDVLALAGQAKNVYLLDQLAAVEYMNGTIVELVQKTYPHLAGPLQDVEPFPHYMLLETHGGNNGGRRRDGDASLNDNGGDDETAFDEFISYMFDEQLIRQGVVADDLTQRQALWNLRESCNPAAAATGCTYKYDVSLPESAFDDFMETMKRHLSSTSSSSSAAKEADPELVITGWGHLLDGNLHFNVTTPGTFAVSTAIKDRIEPFVYDEVLRRGGSISAEHGIGQAKVKYMNQVHDTATLALMRNIKALLDPHGILNPGKVLPPASALDV
jgi:FAD/FMN-containing dehydrogenase